MLVDWHTTAVNPKYVDKKVLDWAKCNHYHTVVEESDVTQVILLIKIINEIFNFLFFFSN